MTDPEPQRNSDDATLFAHVWPVMNSVLGRMGLTESRRRLVAGLRGTVVEVGAGDGVIFQHYPSEVTRVVAVEPDRHLRALAHERAADAPVPVRVSSGVAESLPVADGEADAVVFGLVLCTVPEVAAALGEARRVLAPGGELRLLEHVRAAGVLGGVTDHIAPVWGHVGGGCRPNQDTRTLIKEAGFDVGGLRTRPFPPLVPLMPMMTGPARLR